MAETIKETALRFDQMIAAKAATVELAELLSSVQARGKGQLALLAALSKKSISLLNIEHARHWPEKHASALGEYILQIPHISLPGFFPCGRKEVFIDEALRDAKVPKGVRIQLWRMVVMDGYRFPVNGEVTEWIVPESLYDHPALRRWFCQTKQNGWEDILCSDMQLYRNDLNGPHATEKWQKALNAIEKDSPASLLMPLDIDGRSLPTKYVLIALMKKAVNIITYLYSDKNKTLKRLLSPKQLLFYVCANWNDEAISIATLLDKEKPGFVKNSQDVFGHDALWYTLYQRDRFGRATKAARSRNDLLDKTLIELGCDPKRQNSLGFSYEDLTEPEL